MKFEIKDADRCKSLDALVKRLARGEVPPPTFIVRDGARCESMEFSPRPLDLRFIDKLSREECQVVSERVQARDRQLCAEAPSVAYAVKRTFLGEIRYYTRVDSEGWGILLATNLEHNRLWLTQCRSEAARICKAMNDNPEIRSEMYEVVEISKVEAIKLPSYNHHYRQFKEVTNETT